MFAEIEQKAQEAQFKFQSEAKAANRMKNFLKKHNVLAYKMATPGYVGCPDYITFWPDGKIVFVECKSSAGKLSDSQKAWIEMLQSRKVAVEVITPEDIVTAFSKYI